jgi:hypothetical protein
VHAAINKSKRVNTPNDLFKGVKTPNDLFITPFSYKDLVKESQGLSDIWTVRQHSTGASLNHVEAGS